jgi:DNA-binding response OmpR family regulator
MGKKPKILIIDDEKDFCHFLKFNLETARGYSVFTATNGKSGIKTAIRKNPDLILLDIMMPRISGFDVLKALKKNTRTISIPVAMLTALGSHGSKLKASRLYSSHYFIKPIKIEVLIAGIEKIISAQPRL